MPSHEAGTAGEPRAADAHRTERRAFFTRDEKREGKWQVNTILDASNSVLYYLDDHGLTSSTTYIIMASLRVAFLKERYESHHAPNSHFETPMMS